MIRKEFPPEPPSPSDPDMERAVLGTALFWEDGAWIDEAARLLELDDFSLASHQRIFAAMLAMRKEGLAIDSLLLVRRLGTGGMNAIGSTPHAYIADLTSGLPRWKTPPAHYVAVLKEKTRLRKILAVCAEATAKALAQLEPAHDIVTAMGIALKGIKKK